MITFFQPKLIPLALFSFLLFTVGCDKTEDLTTTLEPSSSQKLENRSDDDLVTEGCTLSLSEDLITATVVNGFVIPTFSSMNDFNIVEKSLIRQCDQACLMNYDLIDLVEGLGYESAWGAYLDENELANGPINTITSSDEDFSIRHVKKSLMNIDGFTRVGDVLYHWKNSKETYAIDLDQEDAYDFMSLLDEDELVEYDKLLQYDIKLEDSDIREVVMTDPCTDDTNDELFGLAGPVVPANTADCGSPQALTSGLTIVYKTSDISSVNGTVSWGDGTSTTVNFTPVSGSLPIGIETFTKLYSVGGIYTISYDLEFNFVSGDLCQRNGDVIVNVGDNTCSRVERVTTFYLNVLGETTNFEEWADNVDGVVFWIKKGRTLSGSRLKARVTSGAWSGGFFRNRVGNHSHTGFANWRNDECSLLGTSSEAENDPEGVQVTLVSTTPKRRWSYIEGDDLRLDFSVTLTAADGTVDVLSGTRYIGPRCM